MDVDENQPDSAPMELDQNHGDDRDGEENEMIGMNSESFVEVPATPSPSQLEEENVPGTSRNLMAMGTEQGKHDNELDAGESENFMQETSEENEESMADADQESVIFEEEFEDLRDNELEVETSGSDDEDDTFVSKESGEDDEGHEAEHEVLNATEDSEDSDEEPEELPAQHESDDKEEAEGNQENEKVVRLPIAKIKKIMKADNPLTLIGKDAIAAMAISAELFISLLTQQSYKAAASSKKKTVQLTHVKTVLPTSPLFDFLEGTLPEYDI